MSIHRERIRDVEHLIEQAKEINDAIVVCQGCESEFLLNQVSENRSIPPEELGGLRGVLDVGIHCPKCDAFYHSFYNTPELRRIRQSVDKTQALYVALQNDGVPVPKGQRVALMNQYLKEYRKKKKAMQKAFDATQKMVIRRRERYGQAKD